MLPQRTHTAVFWRDEQLGDLSPVDTEDVFHLPREDVPDDDREVHPSGDEVALVVAGGDLVRVQQARHLVPVASQRAVRGPACHGERKRNSEGFLTLCSSGLRLTPPNCEIMLYGTHAPNSVRFLSSFLYTSKSQFCVQTQCLLILNYSLTSCEL